MSGGRKIDVTTYVWVNSALILTLVKKVGLNLENEEVNLPYIKAFLIEQYM